MRKKIFEELLHFYKEKMVYAIMSGTRRPSLEAIVSLENKLNIPVSAWLDIKSYLQENDTKEQCTSATTPQKEGVA
jgi:hypothetical protein